MLFIIFLSLIKISVQCTEYTTENFALRNIKNNNTDKLPVVLMHGLLSNVENMNQLKDYLITNFELDVIVPEIGDGSSDSVNMALYKQGEILCNELQNYSILQNGFNFIGISQGGILGRYYIEKCNGYKVNNFITLVTPHGGVYNKLGNLFDMYSEYNIEHRSFASYWRNPFKYDLYLELILLADLNNEGNINIDNKNNFASINNFVMVYSTVDKIVLPPESGKFSTYQVGTMDIVSLEETSVYVNLGLDKLNETNRLHVYSTNCTHDEHKDFECFKELHDMFEIFCS